MDIILRKGKDIGNLSKDLYNAAVMGRVIINDEIVDATSRTPDCVFVHAHDWNNSQGQPGATYGTFIYSRRKALEAMESGRFRELSKCESGLYVAPTRHGLFYICPNNASEDTELEHEIKIGHAIRDKDYWKLFKLQFELISLFADKISRYRFSFKSGKKLAGKLMLKKAKEISERENLMFIDTVVRS